MTKNPKPVPILGLAHIGIRVHDLARSVRFYEILGFTKTAGPVWPRTRRDTGSPVGTGAEPDPQCYAGKRAEYPDGRFGQTSRDHAFCAAVPGHPGGEGAALGGRHPLSGGPVRFGPQAQGIFVRDPDRNVIELHQRG